MQTSHACRPTLHLNGVVRRVDPVGREIEVCSGGVVFNFDAPPDCVVTLRGERVKLRLVQPRDRVRVAYAESQGRLTARTVDVQPGDPPLG
ncbi:hypothetical protein J0H58_29925 [bacterium]|nr:hypothetical protein [bacterium]